MGKAGQGEAVALAADGNTAIVGGTEDGSTPSETRFDEAAWIWTRDNNGVWMQQGSKLVGSGGSNGAQGKSVALSADGNTALIGGYNDGGGTGAAWLWTRSGGTWREASKLVGTGASGLAAQGFSVALSADGNTALVGGYADNGGVGAAWVWIKSNGAWTQQGAKLVAGTGTSTEWQGFKVALSGDGDTALVGAPFGNGAYVWTRSGGAWTRQQKLVSPTPAAQGETLGLSADGKTAIVGGHLTDDLTSVWIRRGSGWIEQGMPLAGSFAIQGMSASVAGDGRTIVAGNASGGWGGVRVFVASKPLDFDGDDKADILWRHTQGDTVLWQMNGTNVLASVPFGALSLDWHVATVGYFDADNHPDILWRTAAGAHVMWFMNGPNILGTADLGVIQPSLQVVASGDYNGDHHADLLWREIGPTGLTNVKITFMNGGLIIGDRAIGSVDSDWQVTASGDYNGDGRSDILWRHTSGALTMWLMDDVQIIGVGGMGVTDPAWRVIGSGDYNGDGSTDILWRHSSGALTMWLTNGSQIIGWAGMGVIDPAWQVVGSNDYDGDGRSDILWHHPSGFSVLWAMNGTQITGWGLLPWTQTSWQILPL